MNLQPGVFLGRGDIEFMLLNVDGLPSEHFDLFLKSGHIRRDCPELMNMVECEQDSEHHPEGDAWEHTLLALDTARGLGLNDASDLPLLLAVLLHDTGKPSTARRIDGKWSFNGHDAAGVPIACGFLERFGFDEFIPEILPLVREHMMLYQIRSKETGLLKDDNLTPKAIISLAARLFPATIEQLMDHIRCDKMGKIDEFCPDLHRLEDFARFLALFNSPNMEMLSDEQYLAWALEVNISEEKGQKKVWSMLSKLRQIESKKQKALNAEPAYA